VFGHFSPFSEGYLIVPRARADGSAKSPDFTIRYLKNGVEYTTNQHLTSTLLLKDEDGASIRQKLIALLGSFPTLRFVSLFGDTKQKGPFTLTSQGDVPIAFAKFPIYTSIQFFEDASITPVTLLEQHRMYNPNVVQWISEHYYNSALIDANAAKPVLPEATFCRKFI
jgi:hypothetical protein